MYRRYADPQWVRASSQIYVTSGANCEVLIYGDSTAITGIDPALVSRATGLKTCNVAQTKGSLVVLGTDPLDVYLRHNVRPRFLVLQFSGADFYQPGKWSDATAYMEGGISLIRYYPARMVMKIALQHPMLLLGMMHYAYITAPLNWLQHHHVSYDWHSTPETPIDVHFTLNQPAFQSCAEEHDIDPLFHKPDPGFIAELRRHYGALADHVIIDVAPTSICDSHAAYLRRTLSGLDNTLEQYPLTLFNQGYTHYTQAGARDLSLEVAGQIAATNSTAAALPLGGNR